MTCGHDTSLTEGGSKRRIAATSLWADPAMIFPI
jgi:hypothetical protein